MADNEPTDVATLETEVAAARARFARTSTSSPIRRPTKP